MGPCQGPDAGSTPVARSISAGVAQEEERRIRNAVVEFSSNSTSSTLHCWRRPVWTGHIFDNDKPGKDETGFDSPRQLQVLPGKHCWRCARFVNKK